jgi:hypothetical protein
MRRPHALRLELLHLAASIETGAPLVDASSHGSCDAFQLSLLAQVGLELREHAEHIEEAFAGGGAGIDGLRCRPQRRKPLSLAIITSY